jgi:hypothetical protein
VVTSSSDNLAADSATRTVLIVPGATRVVIFKVKGSLPWGTHQIAATAMAKGQSFQTGYIPIEYPHINPQRIYRPSTLAINTANVVLPAKLKSLRAGGRRQRGASPSQLGVPLTIVTLMTFTKRI